ncbi:tyrosine-type recombinase/integrase [Pseudonocardia nigra]|uniref:tyrosine-type recombinase/integrase n=1 Tax=Pseudonocardia nigra TaxID=1921578 RepID=UPI001C5D3762|nr:tyrosine-type recombinase/integrase [Pseudonocardia nigra]
MVVGVLALLPGVLVDTCLMRAGIDLRVERRDDGWVLAGPASEDVRLVNDYLGYLGDRHYAAGTRRGYAFDLLALLRWLADQDRRLDQVDTQVLLGFLAFCRSGTGSAGSRGGADGAASGERAGLAAATVNRRLAAVGGLFAFRAMRDPSMPNPVPTGAAARRAAPGQRDGLLGHLARPQPRSGLRVREPRRLPRALAPEESSALLGSLRSWRDRAIAGLMLFCGLRSAEVLALRVADVDIARGWARVAGKGRRERPVPVDAQVAGLVQTYLLAERPDTTETALFVVAKGRNRGQPLTPAGLRTIFRYHREQTGVAAAHPHALRHSFGTALAEAGVDLAVIQALLGHAHVDSSAGYIHLAPVRVRAAYDAARERQRAQG